jgi:hypothetical protein
MYKFALIPNFSARCAFPTLGIGEYYSYFKIHVLATAMGMHLDGEHYTNNCSMVRMQKVKCFQHENISSAQRSHRSTACFVR